MNHSPEFTKTRTLLAVNEIINKHQERYIQELLVKNQDLQRALKSTYTPVLRHQVQVLEARLDTLEKLEKDIASLGEKQ